MLTHIRPSRAGLQRIAGRRATTAATRVGARRRFIGALLLTAAALDLARCSLVLMTFRHLGQALGLATAGIAAAVVSVAAARSYQAGHRWAGLAAVLTGVVSGPLASASGFRAPFTIPDVATSILGIVLAVAVLSAVGRGTRGQSAPAGNLAAEAVRLNAEALRALEGIAGSHPRDHDDVPAARGPGRAQDRMAAIAANPRRAIGDREPMTARSPDAVALFAPWQPYRPR